MANLSQTAANVGIGNSGTRTRVVQAGAAVTNGQPVYLSSAKYYPADANLASSANATGIALTAASTDGFFLMQEGAGGLVNLGATLAVGQVYCVSATTGAICPYADLLTGEFVCILGIATTTALLQTVYAYSSVAKA